MPAAQEKVKFLGVIAAAVAAGLTIAMLARTFQFGEAMPGDLRPVLASPQASIMKALVEGFMSHQPVPYSAGAFNSSGRYIPRAKKMNDGWPSISMMIAIIAPRGSWR